MLRIEKILEGNVAPALRKRAALLTLPYQDRCRGQLAVTLDDGREAALFLPNGAILRHETMLVATDGTLIKVVAAPQAALRVTSADPLVLLRAAYRLGSQHTPVQVEADALLLECNPVLRDMLLGWGAQVTETQAAFDPESEPDAHSLGCEHGHEHRHEHGHTHEHVHDHGHCGHNHEHDHSHAYAHEHEHEHEHEHHNHTHEHVHDHAHSHDREHNHSHAHDHEHERNHTHEHGHDHNHQHGHDHSHNHKK